MKKGLLSEVDHIDQALANTLTVQMRLGMFDGSAHPYDNLGPRDVCSPAHQQLALEAATQGIVLLKNRGPSLPLSTRRHPTVAVIGPNSDVNVTMIGNYAGKYVINLQHCYIYIFTIHQTLFTKNDMLLFHFETLNLYIYIDHSRFYLFQHFA